jgi:acetyltransferase-like isoleucine patch superfamily enzyme
MTRNGFAIRARLGRGAGAGDGKEESGVTQKKFKASGIGRLRALRRVLVGSKKYIYTKLLGMDIHPTAEISMSAKLDTTHPRGVHIGAYTYMAFESRILCHDRTRGLRLDTRIGRNCFIGGRSLILPGVEIGDGCVIGAGSVVTRSIPAGCVAAGNPARVLQEGVKVGPYGRFEDADDNEAQLAAQAGADS